MGGCGGSTASQLGNTLSSQFDRVSPSSNYRTHLPPPCLLNPILQFICSVQTMWPAQILTGDYDQNGTGTRKPSSSLAHPHPRLKSAPGPPTARGR